MSNGLFDMNSEKNANAAMCCVCYCVIFEKTEMKNASSCLNPDVFENTAHCDDLNKTKKTSGMKRGYWYESWYSSYLNYVHVDDRVCNCIMMNARHRVLRFIEDQAFSPSFDLAPPHPLLPLPSASCLSFSVFLRVAG
jgi:hypothetical protein